MKKFLCITLLILLSTTAIYAQRVKAGKFKETLDSLEVLIHERTTVLADLKVRTITRNGNSLDFQFSETLGDIPWRKGDIQWFRARLKELLPDEFKDCSIGEIKCKTLDFSDLPTPPLHNNGHVHQSKYKTAYDPKGPVIVRKADGMNYPKGMSGRHIAIWQSHGRYYNDKTDQWKWQRAQIFGTVEDMFTQSFVLPFLIPMLENSGAYVMTPRERDTQTREVVADNDPAFRGPRTGKLRLEGRYSETGKWEYAGTGFADAKEAYTGTDNPFVMGSARKAKCSPDGGTTAQWTADIPERGFYAVYVSYKTLPESSTSAYYTVRHLGGESLFIVNQKMGGGTWIYLGTFEFAKGSDNFVRLDNRGKDGKVVTADAVRFGGGMGKIARGPEDEPKEEWRISGMPAYMEGALYSMQYAGIDSTILHLHEGDYTNDFADRGPWVARLSGGSRVNPKEEGLGIPFDLSLAFHSDAGVSPNDSIVGTLAIYTRLANNSPKLPNGEDRSQAREYADYVQSQIVSDIRALVDSTWTRREIWDRSYSEARTPSVPALLTESLSHQNFADMKYGLDPGFRFILSRAVYKGMLKFLSGRYGVPYAVQPLPVRAFSAILDGEEAVLSWFPTEDRLEPTALPKGYRLYTRIDDGAFDDGVNVSDQTIRVPIEKGHIYSFRITAWNDGGMSFPSEILSVGIPAASSGQDVLVVNNFDRVSGPTWFDSPSYAGFLRNIDGGVAWGWDIPFIGESYEYRRINPWIDDDNPGFGASFSDEAGNKYAGNTFDYPYVHGKALMAAGRAFSSVSAEAFEFGDFSTFGIADIICGKQVTVATGRPGAAPDRFKVFPTDMKDAIRKYTSAGGSIIISGAYIGTDPCDEIYPGVKADSLSHAEGAEFISGTLGYRWVTNFASKTGTIWPMRKVSSDIGTIRIHRLPNSKVYNVENPDGIAPASDKARSILRYKDTDISAAVFYKADNYSVVSFGFPIETVIEDSDIEKLLKTAVRLLEER
ncbi:MAG: xanthan lyase [Bacteroidales bacterium]|nr:xanthan lyase [Bacteroidales bacterium]